MAVTRYLRRGAVVLAAAAVFSLPQQGRAQSMNMNASLGAECRGQCDIVLFTLNLPGVDGFIDLIRLFSSDPGTWQFAGLLGVLDQNGAFQAGWSGQVNNSGLLLRATGGFAAEALSIYVTMSTWGSQDQLFNGSLSVTGQGNTQIDGLGTDISYGASLVPEPASLLLLGSGLVGVIGAARRRRRKDNV